MSKFLLYFFITYLYTTIVYLGESGCTLNNTWCLKQDIVQKTLCLNQQWLHYKRYSGCLTNNGQVSKNIRDFGKDWMHVKIILRLLGRSGCVQNTTPFVTCIQH